MDQSLAWRKKNTTVDSTVKPNLDAQAVEQI
jgi:hypothetical protein